MFTVTAGKHTSHMDTAGVELMDFCRIPSFESHIINQSPQGVDLKLVGLPQKIGNPNLALFMVWQWPKFSQNTYRSPSKKGNESKNWVCLRLRQPLPKKEKNMQTLFDFSTKPLEAEVALVGLLSFLRLESSRPSF